MRTRRLDSYKYNDVGFIKIDVEGHELAALEAAAATIVTNRPTLLIGSEGRHAPGAPMTIFAWMGARRYDGYFLEGHHLVPLAAFDLARHQDSANIGGWRSRWERRGTYINNFIFLPAELREELLGRAAALGFTQS